MPVEVSTQARARGIDRLQTSQVAEEVSATLLFLSPLVPSIDAFIDAICIARLGVWPTSEFIDDIAVGVAYQCVAPQNERCAGRFHNAPAIGIYSTAYS